MTTARNDPVICIEFDLWDGEQIQTLRLSNIGPITRTITVTSATNYELREDGSYELREDGSIELRD